MIKKFDSFISEGNDWLSKKDIERGEYGIHHKKPDISTYDVNHENVSLDDVLEPGDAALLLVVEGEELLDNFIHYINKSMGPAEKDRFTKMIKFVK